MKLEVSINKVLSVVLFHRDVELGAGYTCMKRRRWNFNF